MSRTRFLVLYLLFMFPTYVLPYFGSNSVVAQTLLLGSGFFLTILHVLALAVLIGVAASRGRATGQPAMVALAVAAAIFDMVPLLSAIPLVPTVLHGIALVMGLTDKRAAPAA